MDANLDRAKVLTEALPYIQQYNGKIVVINCGGVPMTDPELREAVMSDIIMLRLVGIKVVLVHGIGPEAKQALKEAGMELVAVYDAFTREPVKETSDRVYFVVRECGK